MKAIGKRTAVHLLALAGAVLLASCASLPSGASDDIDFVKVAQIERAARAYGTQVIWVNYPLKRSEATK